MRPDRAAGILLHPTSLPGPHGSGDLGAEAYRFVDWLASAGQRLWQMLPIGEIGSGNSPYMSPSSSAGNVLLIDLHRLAQHGWLQPQQLQTVPGLHEDRVDYPHVRAFRMQRLYQASVRFFAQPADAHREDFERFCAAERHWLDDYALFMALQHSERGRTWNEWDPPLARREADALRAAAAERREALRFWKFCQWNFRLQWSELRAYAHQRGVRLIGDLPIFPALQSAEVWANQRLFELDEGGRPTAVAGVPPDYFSATGQRWGNPLYRWSAHEASGYAWWIERLRALTQLVDLVRIDHFRGFAAHWEIPAAETTAINGRWRPGPGARLFDALVAAFGELPVIAEDLGVITDDVVELRRRFGLPGMHVLQFAFESDAANPHLPHRCAPDSVIYTGTHDNDTAVGWWRRASGHEKRFAMLYLGTDGHEIHWDLIRAASASVAAMTVVPMQDVLGLDGSHRLNRPGAASGCWEWRVRASQLPPGAAERLARLAAAHGRCDFSRAAVDGDI